MRLRWYDYVFGIAFWLAFDGVLALLVAKLFLNSQSGSLSFEAVILVFLFLLAAGLFMNIRYAVRVFAWHHFSKQKVADILTQEMRVNEFPRSITAFDWESYFSALVADEAAPKKALIAASKIQGALEGIRTTSISRAVSHQTSLDNAIRRYLA